MPSFGSDSSYSSTTRAGIADDANRVLINADTSFGASPLGIAARTQAIYGVPNATFNLTPPTPGSAIIANDNDLPYWKIENLSDGVMTATTVFDSTTQTWGVTIAPGTAASGSTLTLTTRAYLITDDNLSVRQKALAVLQKSGTAGTTTSQWNLQLSAIYYSATDTALSTAVIGTALDTGTWTSFSGMTTVGGSAINAAAQYVDLAFTLTATANITGSASATIKSLILGTKLAALSSIATAETFTSSGVWTVPPGVTSVDVIAMGCGGGGGGGGGYRGTVNNYSVRGGGGGGGGAFVYAQGVSVAGLTSVTIGIGAAGAGGTAATNLSSGFATGATGGNGGASSFGTIVVANGGNGGAGGGGAAGTAATGSGGTGGTGGTVSGALLFLQKFNGKDGGSSGVIQGNGTIVSAPTNGGDSTLVGFTDIPYYGTLNPAAGTNGSTGSGGTAGGVGTAGIAGITGGGGAGGALSGGSGSVVKGTATNGGAGGGGGGGENRVGSSNIDGGNGGNAGSASVGGGGGGGASVSTGLSTNTSPGDGGNGGSGGFVTVIYVS